MIEYNARTSIAINQIKYFRTELKIIGSKLSTSMKRDKYVRKPNGRYKKNHFWVQILENMYKQKEKNKYIILFFSDIPRPRHPGFHNWSRLDRRQNIG